MSPLSKNPRRKMSSVINYEKNKNSKNILRPTAPDFISCPAGHQASCSWQTVQTGGGVAGVPDYSNRDCGPGITQSADAYCSSPKPGDTINGYSICCCGNPLGRPPAPTPPKFILPDIQIPIPGLTLTPSSSIQTILVNGAYTVQIPWISEYITGLYNYGLSIAGILAAIMLMAGGLLWLVSGGDASKVTQAKELIGGSVTGLIILMSSYILLYTINPDLTKFPAITLGVLAHQDFELAESKLGSQSEQYKALACPTDTELTNGVQFYATGYFKEPFQSAQDLRYLCMVHMQGRCPNGVDTNSVCVLNGTPFSKSYRLSAVSNLQPRPV